MQNDGPLPPQGAAEAGFQILSALRAARAVGVLHGDIRPGNVLLGPGNWAMLTGFGMDPAGDGRAAPKAPAGSPCYLAPERASGRPASPAADLWSLGATLYAAVEGRPAFHGDDAAAVRAAVVGGHPDLPSRAGPLWPVISGLLRKDAAARPDAARLDWLLRRVAGAGDAAGRVPPGESPGPPADAVPAPAGPPEANHDGAAPGVMAPPRAEAADAGRDGPPLEAGHETAGIPDVPQGDTKRDRAYYAGLRAWAKEHGVRIHEQVRDGRVVGYYYPKEARDGYAAYLTGRHQ